MTKTQAHPSSSRLGAGILFGLLAYGIWGFFPLFFRQLGHIPPADIMSNRAVWAFIVVSLVLLLQQGFQRVLAVLKHPRYVQRLALAGGLVGANWLMFVWAVDQHQVIASSIGYFLTPLVNILLGYWVLQERLNHWEWLAVGLALLGVVNEFIALGAVPWVSLFLAITFGVYGLVRKQVPVDAVSGLWVETLAMLPFVLAYAIWQANVGHAVFVAQDWQTQGLMAAAGLLTAVPLMAFAAATQRLTLATVGMLMYINPTMQFATAVFLFNEPFAPNRLLTFVCIWSGLALYSWNGWRKYRDSQ